MAGKAIIELEPHVDWSKVEAGMPSLEMGGGLSGDDVATFKAGNSELQKRNEILKQESVITGNIEAAQKRQLPTIRDISKSLSGMSSGVLAQVAQYFDTGTKASQKFGVSVRDTGKTISGVLVNSVGQFNTVLVQNQKAANQATDAQESLRKKLKALREEIAGLILAGDQQSDKYKQLVQQAGEIKDAIGDASNVISRAGSDTRAMDNVIQVATGITAGFTAATSAAALFGDESEDTQKTLLKVNAAMGVLQGLQQIDNVLTNEAFKNMVQLNTQRLVLNARIAIENGLQSSSIIVRGGATAAQWALNAAMAANPIGLVTVAIAALIAAMYLFVSNASRVAQKQADINAALQSATVGLDAETAAMQRFNKEQQAGLDAAGARSSEKLQRDLATLRATGAAVVRELNRINVEIDKAKGDNDVSTEDFKKLTEQKTKLEQTLAEINADGKSKQVAANKAALEETSNDVIAAADNQIKIAKNGSAAELAAQRNGANVRRTELLKQLQNDADIKKTSIDQDKDLSARRAQIEADYQDSIQGINNTAEDRSKAAIQRRLAAQKAGIDNLLILAREGSAEQLKIQEDTIRKEAQLQQASVETRNADPATVARERANIEIKAQKEISKLRIDFANKQVKDESEVQLLVAQARVAAFREGTAEYYAAQHVFLAQQADNSALEVQQSTEAEGVKAAKIKLIYVQLNKDIDTLQRQQFAEQLARQAAQIDALSNLAVTRLNIKASDPTISEASRFKAQQDARTEQLAQIELERARIHEKALTDSLYREAEYQKDLTDNTAKAEEKRAEIVQANAEREKEIRRAVEAAIITAAQEAATAAFEIDKAERDAELQNALDKLDREKTAALATKNITESQKAAIQKKYDRETAKLKNEAAKKERNAQRSQAIVNGLLAVTNALATVQPFYLAIIAAAGAAITAGIQVAKINSTPLPAYAVGTPSAKRGYALVGEKGPEIVEFAGGEKVWTATQSDKMMKEWNAANHTATIAEHRASQASSSTEIDYDELGRSVAKYMPKSAEVHMIADQHGLTIFLQSENSKQTIRNRRYSTGG